MDINRMFSSLEQVMLPVAAKISSQRHIMAIRDGFIAVMPFMIIGSFILIFAYPPFSEDNQFFIARGWLYIAAEYKQQLLTPYNMTMGIMSVYICPAISYCLARHYRLEGLNTALLALVAFLLICCPLNNGTMESSYLGGSGIFTAIIVAVLVCELSRVLHQKNIGIRLPEQVPDNIRKSFNQLIPLSLVLLILFPVSLAVQSLSGMLIPQAIMALFSPLLSASDSLPAVIIAVIICHVLWFAGIHGATIVSGFLQAFWLTNLGINQSNLASGLPAEHIFVEPFWAFFITLGGSGATLGLVLLYLRSKSAHLRSIGKISLVPSLFNINEPVIFGSPIVMNTLFFIPFILTPVVNAVLAWFAIKYGLVAHIISLAPWTSPGPIGAAWATGWDINAALLVLVLVCSSALIYYPFCKLYERSLLAEEQNSGV